MHLRTVTTFALGATLIAASADAQVGGSILLPNRGEPITRVATRGAAFLSLGVGARALGLAGAFAATASDLSSMYWNVAGLTDLSNASVFLSQERMYGHSGLHNNYLAAAVPGMGGAVGVSVTSFSSGKIPRTTEEWPEGNDPAAGSFVEWSAMSVGLHYARPFTDRLSAGATVKYAKEGIQFASADYTGVDLGLRFRTGLFGSTLGASIANLGGTGKMSGPAIKRRFPPNRDPLFPTQRTLEGEISPGAYQMPTVLRFAVQTDLIGSAEALFGRATGTHRITTFADMTDAIDAAITPAMAAEYGFSNRVFLRIGKRFLNDERGTPYGGASYGAGAAIPIGSSRRFLVDYAYRNNGELPHNHVFSFQLGN
jgi:hypothetical protein